MTNAAGWHSAPTANSAPSSNSFACCCATCYSPRSRVGLREVRGHDVPHQALLEYPCYNNGTLRWADMNLEYWLMLIFAFIGVEVTIQWCYRTLRKSSAKRAREWPEAFEPRKE